MTALLLAATLAVTLLSAASAEACIIPPHSNRWFPRVGMYSAMNGRGEPFVRVDGTLDSALCRVQAAYDVVILDIAPLLKYPQLPRYLRSVNPRINLHAYVVACGTWNDPSSTDWAQRYYQAVKQTGGILWCKGNKPCVFSNVDLGNPVTALACADTILAGLKAGHFDGVFLDVWCPRMSGIVADRDTVDWARMGYSSPKAWNEAWSAGHWSMAARLQAGAGHAIFVGNCGPSGERQRLHGWMRENFPYQNGGTWATNMVGMQTPWGLDPGYLTDDSLYRQPAHSWLVMDPQGDPATIRRRARFGLGSASLGGGLFSWCRCEWRAREFRWMPEYSVRAGGQATMDAIAKGWLGMPLEVYRRLSSGLYVREFERGLVLVNPTNGTLSYYGTELWGTIVAPYPEYRRRMAKSFKVPPQDALFLQRTGK